MAAQLWHTRDVATYLNVKESTIRYWVHTGFIPHIKFHGAVRYRQADIDGWLDKRSVSGRTKKTQEIADGILRTEKR